MTYVNNEPSYLLALASAGYDSRPYWTKIYSQNIHAGLPEKQFNTVEMFTYTTELEQHIQRLNQD